MLIDSNNLIVTKTIAFSISIVEFCESLEREKKYVIARQLLRSATSIGANVFEAQNCESKADFIHKMKIAAKEANETFYWLTICEKCDSYNFDRKHTEDLEVISKILSKIIATTKQKKSTF